MCREKGLVIVWYGAELSVGKFACLRGGARVSITALSPPAIHVFLSRKTHVMVKVVVLDK